MTKINYLSIPTEGLVAFYTFDWTDKATIWNDWTFTNAVFTSSDFAYNEEQVSWGATTSFTYSSITFTESYLLKNWTVIKNSSEVTSTALNWVSWNDYQWILFYNRNLSTTEENNITQYVKRKLWYTKTPISQNFPKYSTRNLQEWQVLRISKPANGWIYYDQTWNWNNSTSVTNVTDSTVWLNNVMSFNGSNSNINIPDNTDLRLSGNYTYWWRFKFNNITAIQRLINKDDALDSSAWYAMVLTSFASPFTIGLTHNNWWTWYWWNTWYTPPIWKWTQILTRYNWTTLELFVNWVSEFSKNVSVNLSWEADNLFIGTYWTTSWQWQYFNWDITNPIIHNEALSDEEILQDYYSNKII
jgi:hypothetical protein